MALDLFLTILFVILIRLLIVESFLTTYSIILSNEWWEIFLTLQENDDCIKNRLIICQSVFCMKVIAIL